MVFILHSISNWWPDLGGCVGASEPGGSTAGPSSGMVQEVLQRLLQVALADPERAVRQILLNEIKPHFDCFLRQSVHLETLFLFLSDEDLHIRIETVKLLGRLALLNPGFVLPPLRQALRRLIVELQLQSDTNSKDKNDKQNQKGYKFKRYKIQEVIKPNQVILVQVIKDERGQKGAALSTFISIAGKYIVLMPNTPKGGGISRKIFNPADRKKIRTILNEISIPKEMGLIVRTAGSNKTKRDIEYDLSSLIETWDKIKENAMNSMAPALIHQESDIIKRTLRDIYDDDTKNIIIEGNTGYQKAKNFMKLLMPNNLKKIKKYRDKQPLFIKEKIEEKLNEIYDTTVKLNSGGYLVINPTEALVSIDINSGKSIRQKNVESTALDTNLEAAEEIA